MLAVCALQLRSRTAAFWPISDPLLPVSASLSEMQGSGTPSPPELGGSEDGDDLNRPKCEYRPRLPPLPPAPPSRTKDHNARAVSHTEVGLAAHSRTALLNISHRGTDILSSRYVSSRCSACHRYPVNRTSVTITSRPCTRTSHKTCVMCHRPTLVPALCDAPLRCNTICNHPKQTPVWGGFTTHARTMQLWTMPRYGDSRCAVFD